MTKPWRTRRTRRRRTRTTQRERDRDYWTCGKPSAGWWEKRLGIGDSAVGTRHSAGAVLSECRVPSHRPSGRAVPQRQQHLEHAVHFGRLVDVDLRRKLENRLV